MGNDLRQRLERNGPNDAVDIFDEGHRCVPNVNGFLKHAQVAFKCCGDVQLLKITCRHAFDLLRDVCEVRDSRRTHERWNIVEWVKDWWIRLWF